MYVYMYECMYVFVCMCIYIYTQSVSGEIVDTLGIGTMEYSE